MSSYVVELPTKQYNYVFLEDPFDTSLSLNLYSHELRMYKDTKRIGIMREDVLETEDLQAEDFYNKHIKPIFKKIKPISQKHLKKLVGIEDL
jgi:hypothetical protein